MVSNDGPEINVKLILTTTCMGMASMDADQGRHQEHLKGHAAWTIQHRNATMLAMHV